VGVEFLAKKERIPPSLWLSNAGTPRKLKIQAINRGDDLWVCESCEPLVGAEHELKPDLSIPGYKIDPIRGINRLIGNKCYAFFSFRPEKTSRTLEVLAEPSFQSFPFSFKANSTDFTLCSPQPGKACNRVEGLRGDVRLKLYELQGDKQIFLFYFDFPWNMKETNQSLDQIAELVLDARKLYRYGKTKLPADLDPTDPYLEIARQQQVSHSEQANRAAKEGVKSLLQLRGLILRDTTEVKP
jgi:hypothetical protein